MRWMAVLVVVDGMGDRPLAELDGATPLERAETPNMDSMAEEGVTGIVDVVSPGVPPGSDTAHLALFGFDPYGDYTGRGAFEALGAGLDVGKGDVAFRGNFATVDDGVVVDRRAGRVFERAWELADELDGTSPPGFPDVEVSVKHSTQHRCAVVLRGPRLSRAVTDVDPHEEGREIREARAADGTDEAERTAAAVNSLVSTWREILVDSPVNDERADRGRPPVNTLLLRGAGVLPELPTVDERFGVGGKFVSPVALYGGLALAAGMDPVPLDEEVREMDDLSQVEAIGGAALGAVDAGFLFVHFKGADNASHDGLVGRKVEVIEAVDSVVGELREESRAHLAVTADHSSPCSVGGHSGDPVPIVIDGPGTRPDDVDRFGERACAGGGLHRLRGRDVLYELMDLEGRVSLHGG